MQEWILKYFPNNVGHNKNHCLYKDFTIYTSGRKGECSGCLKPFPKCLKIILELL